MGMAISSVFLAATLVVYLVIPKVKPFFRYSVRSNDKMNRKIQFNNLKFPLKLLNLHGKTLACYVASLLTGYITLAIVQFHTTESLTYDYEAGKLDSLKI